MRKRLKSFWELEAATRVIRKDPIAGRVGRIYSRGEIQKVEEHKTPWYRGEGNGKDSDRI